MKKLLALLLALVMVLSLAACGEKAEVEEDEKKPSATEAKGEETEPEKEPAEKPEKTEPEETKPSKKDSDFEKGMELLEEYAEVLDDVLALVEAEGMDAEDAELEALIEEYESAIADIATNGDMSDEEYDEFEEAYLALIEAFNEELSKIAEAEEEEETDYELTMRLLEEYAYVLEEVIALIEEEGEDATDAELEAAIEEYESALSDLFANGDMTEEEAEETQEIYLAMIEAFYEAIA